MPLPLLGRVTARTRQAYPIIQSGVRAGLSGNKIFNLLRDEGIGARRADVLDIVRAERHLAKAEAGLKSIPRDRVPNLETLPEALTAMRRPYSFNVRVRGQETGTGNIIDQRITVSTSLPLTRAEIEATAADAVARGQSGNISVITEVQLQSGLRAGEAGTF